MSHDEIRDPSHYRLADGREAFEAVIAPVCDTLSARGFPGSAVYAVGNALKYICRLGAKGTGTAPTDLRKAIRYLEMALGAVEADDTALANQIYREMRDDAPRSLPVKPAWYLPPGIEILRQDVEVGSPEEGSEGYEERWVWRWREEGLTGEASTVAECLQEAWQVWGWERAFQASEARPTCQPPSQDAPGSRSARVDKTVEAIRAFHAAENAPAAGPPPGLEEARRACCPAKPAAPTHEIEAARVAEKLLPFPRAIPPRKVLWPEVLDGSIVVVFDGGAGSPVATRWASGGGMWVGPSCVALEPGPWQTWENMGVRPETSAWVVAEGLSDAEIREWVLGSRKPA